MKQYAIHKKDNTDESWIIKKTIINATAAAGGQKSSNVATRYCSSSRVEEEEEEEAEGRYKMNGTASLFLGPEHE